MLGWGLNISLIWLVSILPHCFWGARSLLIDKPLWLTLTLSATSAAACWAELFIYRTFCWNNSVQPTKAPTKMNDTNPILVRIGCQYNHLFLFRSVSFSLCFICCTFWAVLAFLSSRIRFRRMLQKTKTKKKEVHGRTYYSNTEDRSPNTHPPSPIFLNSLNHWNKKKRGGFSIFSVVQRCTLDNSATICGTIFY